jgi:hypothetical protein
LVDLLKLWKHVALKRLTAKTRLNGHDEHEINLVEKGLDCSGRSSWVQRDTTLAPE